MVNQVEKEKMKQTLVLENRNCLKCDAVLNVDCYDENQVIASLKENQLVITGTNLKIKSFNLESESLEITGEINCIKYQVERAKSFVKRLFK